MQLLIPSLTFVRDNPRIQTIRVGDPERSPRSNREIELIDRLFFAIGNRSNPPRDVAIADTPRRQLVPFNVFCATSTGMERLEISQRK